MCYRNFPLKIHFIPPSSPSWHLPESVRANISSNTALTMQLHLHVFLWQFFFSIISYNRLSTWRHTLKWWNCQGTTWFDVCDQGLSTSFQTTSIVIIFFLYPTGPNSVLYINHLSTSTYPPSLSEGFSATYDLGLREPIDGDVDVKLDLKVKLGKLWITIPCVSQIGSW